MPKGFLGLRKVVKHHASDLRTRLFKGGTRDALQLFRLTVIPLHNGVYNEPGDAEFLERMAYTLRTLRDVRLDGESEVMHVKLKRVEECKQGRVFVGSSQPGCQTCPSCDNLVLEASHLIGLWTSCDNLFLER